MTTTQPPSPPLMDRDQVWQVIDAQRMNLAALLEQLSGDDWRQPSLCAGWTVRDVAAHLTLQQVGPGGAGPEVHAPMSAILLICAGRLAALPQLSGEGAPAFAARLTAVQPS